MSETETEQQDQETSPATDFIAAGKAKVMEAMRKGGRMAPSFHDVAEAFEALMHHFATSYVDDETEDEAEQASALQDAYAQGYDKGFADGRDGEGEDTAKAAAAFDDQVIGERKEPEAKPEAQG